MVKANKKTSDCSLIERKFYRGVQSWNYSAHWNLAGEKIHITIKRDSYDFQSYARCDILNRTENKWNQLCNTHHTSMASIKVGVYASVVLGSVEEALFIKDEATLLALAEKLLA